MPTDAKGKQWNSTLKRRTPLQAKRPWARSNPVSKKPAFKKGPKTKQWDADRAKIKKSFERAGITRCELGYSGCQGYNFLGFAHSRKRRDVITLADREKVILSCAGCHDTIEKMPHAQMKYIVDLVIIMRETPVESIFDKIEEEK